MDAVIRFLRDERRCCPFASFSLEADAGNGPIRLRMTGAPGTRELIEAAYPPPG